MHERIKSDRLPINNAMLAIHVTLKYEFDPCRILDFLLWGTEFAQNSLRVFVSLSVCLEKVERSGWL